MLPVYSKFIFPTEMFNKLSAKGGGNALLVWTRIWSFFLVFLFVLKLHDLILKEILATVFF